MKFISIDQYECNCGECPMVINVLKNSKKNFFDSSRSEKQDKKILRMLKAYANYNEADQYDLDLLVLYSSKCLQLCKYDEEQAFNMLAQAMDDGTGPSLMQLQLEEEEKEKHEEDDEQAQVVKEIIQFQVQTLNESHDQSQEELEEEEYEEDHPHTLQSTKEHEILQRQQDQQKQTTVDHLNHTLTILDDYYNLEFGKQISNQVIPNTKIKKKNPLKRFLKNLFSRKKKKKKKHNKAKSKLKQTSNMTKDLDDGLESRTSSPTSDQETEISSISSLELEEQVVNPNAKTEQQAKVDNYFPLIKPSRHIPSQHIEVYVDQYLCDCGTCPHAKAIKNPTALFKHSIGELKCTQVVRLLQAYSTYNEAQVFQADLVFEYALECLIDCEDDEDLAFTTLIQLMENRQLSPEETIAQAHPHVSQEEDSSTCAVVTTLANCKGIHLFKDYRRAKQEDNLEQEVITNIKVPFINSTSTCVHDDHPVNKEKGADHSSVSINSTSKSPLPQYIPQYLYIKFNMECPQTSLIHKRIELEKNSIEEVQQNQEAASSTSCTRPIERSNLNQKKKQSNTSKRIKSFLKNFLRISSKSKPPSQQQNFRASPASINVFIQSGVCKTSTISKEETKVIVSLHAKYAPWSFKKLQEERKKYIVAPEAYMWI
jgi:hypothetical protein